MSTKKEFLDYIFDIEIPTNISIEEERKIHSDIFQKSWDITPSNLYRYRSCNRYSFDALENDKFLLSKPTSFNDPFDSLIYVDKNSIYEELFSPKDINLITELKTNQKFKEEQVEYFGEEYIEKLIKIGDFKTKEEKEYYTKLSKEIYSKFLDDLIELSFNSLKQSTLIGCLSEKYDSILMWSHYAQNHTGFVLNYDFKSRFSIHNERTNKKYSEFIDKKIFPVQYSNKRYNATKFVENNLIYNLEERFNTPKRSPFFDKLFYYKYLLHKSNDWKYEREWRIIKQTNIILDEKKPDFDFIHHIKPKEIFLGAKISKWDKKILLSIAKEKEIPVFEMELDYFNKQYKLSKKKVK